MALVADHPVVRDGDEGEDVVGRPIVGRQIDCEPETTSCEDLPRALFPLLARSPSRPGPARSSKDAMGDPALAEILGPLVLESGRDEEERPRNRMIQEKTDGLIGLADSHLIGQNPSSHNRGSLGLSVGHPLDGLYLMRMIGEAVEGDLKRSRCRRRSRRRRDDGRIRRRRRRKDGHDGKKAGKKAGKKTGRKL
jgi:hypothetical protein